MPSKVVLSFILVLWSCGKSLPVFENMNLADWQQDRNGCSGKRAAMEQVISNQKDKLLALSETQVAELLGRPDRNELYKRNQKFFYYFIHPSPDCDTPKENGQKLVIRFNATGRVKEVTIE
ncbi:MAG: hypothetical protein HRU69_12355 [Flammeovirgaceae bacterium]|nr:MAG: hypothetical protein HRU69_12355 [Flammeovirgaceae bacterium]